MIFRLLTLYLALLSYSLQAQIPPARVQVGHHRGPVFTPNLGQWEGNFSLQTQIPGTGTTVFFAGDAWTFAQRRPFEHGKPISKAETERLSKLPAGFAWRLRFEGSSFTAHPKTAGAVQAPAHYIYQRAQATTIPGSEGAIADIYPGISARMLYAQHNFRFDLNLSAGINPDIIQLSYEGTDVALKNGLLHISSPYGPIYQSVPKAYQVIGKDTIWVQASYTQKGKQIGFALASYDKTKPITIDPTLIFSSYSGSFADNWGSTATYGADGSAFSAGEVFGNGYPTSLGSYSRFARGGEMDMGILKFSSDGTQLLWATYLGGSSNENPTSLVADAAGRLYVLGVTSSQDFPTTATAVDHTFDGGPSERPLYYPEFYNIHLPNGSDITVSCLSADGSQLIASTFLGGAGTDGILSASTQFLLNRNYGDGYRGEIILDARGRPCIATNSRSTDFTPANHESGFLNSQGQALALRLSPNLDTLLDRIAFGGSSLDAAYGLIQDQAGNTFLCGGTTSADFEHTAGSFQPQYGGLVDGFVARIPANWSGIDHATYTGTSEYDQAQLIQINALGEPCVVGQTSGTWFMPDTAHVWHQGSQGGQFIQGFSTNLDTVTFSTVYGGPAPNLVISAFLVDECNKIYIAGWGGVDNQTNPHFVGGFTTGLPVSASAMQRTTDGSDFHLMILDSNARAFVYATFFGANDATNGDHVDGGTSRFDRRGLVYESMCASCHNYAFDYTPIPTTTDAYSTTNNSDNCNNAVFKIDFVTVKALFLTAQIDTCAPFTISFKNRSENSISYQWQFDTLGGSTSLDSIIQFSFPSAGAYTIRLRAFSQTSCVRYDDAEITLLVRGYTFPPTITDTAFHACDNNIITVKAPNELSDYKYHWAVEPKVQGLAGLQILDTSRGFIAEVRTNSSHNQHLVLTTSNHGCNTMRRYFFQPDSASLRYVTHTDYDTCQNLYTVQLRGANPTLPQYLFALSGTDTLRVSPNQNADLQIPGSTTNGPLYIRANREGCVVDTLIAFPLPDLKRHPKAGFTVDTRFPGCSGPAELQLIARSDSSGQLSYYLDGALQPSARIQLPDSAAHLLTQVAHIGTCADTVSQRVKQPVMFIPNILTPDGNNSNDILALPVLDGKPWNLDIYNRWGKRVGIWTEYQSGDFPYPSIENGVYYYRLSGGGMLNPCMDWIEVIHH